jgi:hypothetical protein
VVVSNEGIGGRSWLEVRMVSPACVKALSFRYFGPHSFIREYQSHRTLFVAILKKNLLNLEIQIDGLVEKRRDDFAVFLRNPAINFQMIDRTPAKKSKEVNVLSPGDELAL